MLQGAFVISVTCIWERGLYGRVKWKAEMHSTSLQPDQAMQML